MLGELERRTCAYVGSLKPFETRSVARKRNPPRMRYPSASKREGLAKDYPTSWSDSYYNNDVLMASQSAQLTSLINIKTTQ